MKYIRLCEMGRLEEYLQDCDCSSEQLLEVYSQTRRYLLEKYHVDISKGKEAYASLCPMDIYRITVDYVDHFIEYCAQNFQ